MWLVLVMVSKTVMFLYSFLFDPLSSLSSLFVLSGHKTPFAKRRCDDEAIKEGLDNEARLVRQRQISSSKDNILRSVVVSLSQRKSALPTNKILIPSFREFSDRYVNPCPRSFLPLDTDGVPRGGSRISVIARVLSEVLPTPLLCCYAATVSPIRYHKNRWPPSTPLVDVAHNDVRARGCSFRMIDQKLTTLAPLVRRQVQSRDLAPFLISHPSFSR